MATRKKGAPDLPALLTCREYGHLIGRTHQWVRDACVQGRIPAAQYVANYIWIIPEDALIVPRHLEGFPHHLLDVDLPEEFVLSGKRADIAEAPELKRGPSCNINENNKRYVLWNLRKVRQEREWGVNQLARAAGVNSSKISRIENNREPAWYVTVKKLATTLGVDVEELMHREV